MDNNSLRPEIKLTIADEKRFFGPGTMMLLKAVDETGNVRDACAKCGFSYSKGWTIIRKSEERLGYKIIERQVGGRSGGSAYVTDRGHDLMALYDELEKELTAIAIRKFAELSDKYKITSEK